VNLLLALHLEVMTVVQILQVQTVRIQVEAPAHQVVQVVMKIKREKRKRTESE